LLWRDLFSIKRAWKIITGNIKASDTKSLGYYKLKHFKPWSDEECSKFIMVAESKSTEWR